MPHKDLRPDDLTAIIDSREQTPLALLIPSVRGTLQTGDYSLRGLEHLVAIERKSIQDLAMSCGRERDRFDRCIDRLRHMPLGMIVIEGTEEDIERKRYRGEMHPNAILGAVHSWRARGINIDWAVNAERAALHVSRTLFAFARDRWSEMRELRAGLAISTAPGVRGSDRQDAS